MNTIILVCFVATPVLLVAMLVLVMGTKKEHPVLLAAVGVLTVVSFFILIYEFVGLAMGTSQFATSQASGAETTWEETSSVKIVKLGEADDALFIEHQDGSLEPFTWTRGHYTVVDSLGQLLGTEVPSLRL